MQFCENIMPVLDDRKTKQGTEQINLKVLPYITQYYNTYHLNTVCISYDLKMLTIFKHDLKMLNIFKGYSSTKDYRELDKRMTKDKEQFSVQIYNLEKQITKEGYN